MPSQHKRTFRPTLRPDRALYQRVAAKFRAVGRNMNEEFERWLRYMDGETSEQPSPPQAAADAQPSQQSAEVSRPGTT